MNRTLPVVQSSPGVIDPVCGMTVDPNNAAGSFAYEGKTYYFCATHCLHRFQKDPETNRFVVRVVNRNTREVISQVPEEYVLRLAADMQKDLKKLG